MYNIIRLRKELSSKPKQCELLNELHQQIEGSGYANRLTIVLLPEKGYSSKIKKSVVHQLGYEVVGKKLSNKFDIRKCWD